MNQITTPVKEEAIKQLQVYDRFEISGYIYTGRDAALPKLIKAVEEKSLDEREILLKGSVIFHTAVSPAGIGPTSSNKFDIETSIPALSKAGVKIHLGKGALEETTKRALQEHSSIFAILPPVSALLTSKILSKKIVAFENEGMEAIHELKVDKVPAIVAIAHGRSIFEEKAIKERF